MTDESKAAPSARPRVLIFLAFYLPGVKSGGPLRSIANLVEALGDEIDFRIVTSDRDKEDDVHYKEIAPDCWTKVGKANVLYLSPHRQSIFSLFRLLRSETADFLYLNSFFARNFSILPLLALEVGARSQQQVVLAPRGEFSPGALGLKSHRKHFWIALARKMPAYRNIIWHASTVHEQRDICNIFGSNIRVHVAQDMPDLRVCSVRENLKKDPGVLRIAFLSRIVPKKNLLTALQLLLGIAGTIEFNIYGPFEDIAYGRLCEAEMRRLPGNVRVRFQSHVEHSEVAGIFSSHHLFFFPTLGENYGHVIYESLSAGCPVLISDRTPWHGLERAGAGWDLPLEQPVLFRQALENCIAMTDLQFQEASGCARAFAREFISRQDLVADNRALFALPELSAASGF